MKIRSDFVTNSSSSCFVVITNITNEDKTMMDYLTENLPLMVTSIKNNYITEEEKIRKVKEITKKYGENDIEILKRSQQVFYIVMMPMDDLDSLFVELGNKKSIVYSSESFITGIYDLNNEMM